MKTIAALCMLVDHVGLMFFPNDFRWKIIGRLAMPIFSYGVARGAFYTTSLKRYTKKMLLFSLISQVPFWGMNAQIGQPFFSLHLNVGFTFFLALVSIVCFKQCQEKNKPWIAIIGIIGAILLAEKLNCDYGGYGILMVWISYIAFIKAYPLYQVAFMYGLITIATRYHAPLLCMLQCVGVLGYGIIFATQNFSEKKWKKGFYIFYPLHMLILVGIKWWSQWR